MYKICISRTDSIGDVILTLPLISSLKKRYPESEIHFLGRAYTKPILQLHSGIDKVILYDEIESKNEDEVAKFLTSKAFTHFIHVFPNKQLAKAAKKAGIKNRIGTSHRLYHLNTCNHRVNFTRKNSDLHEAQLNFHLLKPLGIEKIPKLELLNLGDEILNPHPNNIDLSEFGINKESKKVILHPKSQGSAVEWGVQNFIDLAELIASDKCQVLFTGTEKEAPYFRNMLPENRNIIDLSGKLSLEQLITLIEKSDVLVAASTGPLHIAGLLNKHAIGLFSPRRPIHPGRWKPLGTNSETLVYDQNCSKCSKGKECDCIQSIRPETVAKLIS